MKEVSSSVIRISCAVPRNCKKIAPFPVKLLQFTIVINPLFVGDKGTYRHVQLYKLINIPDNRVFSSYQLNAQFLYSITLYMLHYNPQHVSSSTMLIFRRTNCIITASAIVTLCKRPYSMPVESDCSPLSTGILYGCLQRVTIPEAVIIQFVLLKMSKVLLETC